MGYTTPNQLRFAVYTNSTKNSPKLVAQSQLVTIQSVSGPQSFIVSLQGSAGLLIPFEPYLLVIYNQYDASFYFNNNARQPNLITYNVDASSGFPSTLPYELQFDNFLFPLAYFGCTCTTLLGDDNLTDYPDTIELGADGIVYAIGTFQAPSYTLYTSYEFNFTVPDQSGYTTPNLLRFAVYTNDTTPRLVTQSQTATIQSVSGPQNFIVKVPFNVSDILYPGRQYYIGQSRHFTALSLLSRHRPCSTAPTVSILIWRTICVCLVCLVMACVAIYNQYDASFYFNSNAVKGAQIGLVDASGGFPSTLSFVVQTGNFLFPIAYKGCFIAL